MHGKFNNADACVCSDKSSINALIRTFIEFYFFSSAFSEWNTLIIYSSWSICSFFIHEIIFSLFISLQFGFHLYSVSFCFNHHFFIKNLFKVFHRFVDNQWPIRILHNASSFTFQPPLVFMFMQTNFRI